MKKCTFFLITFTLLFSANTLKAQIWEDELLPASFPHFGGLIDIVNDSVAWTWLDSNYLYFHPVRFSAIYKTIDGGKNWIRSSPVSFGYPTSIFGLNSQAAWMTYTDFYNGNQVQKTTDGGVTWQSCNLTARAGFIYFWNDQEGIVAGDRDSLGFFEIYKSVDGGNSWNRTINVPIAKVGEFIRGDNYKVINDELWVSTYDARIFHSSDRGNHWEVYDGPAVDPAWYPYSMDVTDERIVYQTFYTEGKDTIAHHLIYRSRNSGQTWENITSTNNLHFPRDICSVPGSDVLVATFGPLSYFGSLSSNITRISYDQGDSWMEVDTVSPVNHLSFYNTKTGYASNLQSVWNPSSIYRYVGSPLTGLLKNAPTLNVELTITPNPVSEKASIYLNSDSRDDFMILLNTISGELILRESFNQVSEINFTMDLNNLSPGIYIITVANKHGRKAEKIIKL